MILEYSVLIIAFVAFAASLLTLFSGFGLGTLLMPVMALFMPIEIAIAVTAIVHLLNNVFKFLLLAKSANWGIVLRFGVPAIIFAFIGAYLLKSLGSLPKITSYRFLGHEFEITPIKLIIGFIIAAFALLELSPKFKNIAIDRKFLPLGGVLAGFFGGLSGIQGAFRSMFLIKSGLSKEAFIASGVVLAVLVDVSRIIAYGGGALIDGAIYRENLQSIIIATLAAFLGVIIGKKFLEKVTLQIVQNIVAIGLFAIGALMALGIV